MTSRTLFLLLIFVTKSFCSSNIDASITTELTKDSIGENEASELRLTVKGDEKVKAPPEIQAEGLRIIQTSKSTEIKMENFIITAKLTFSYEIIPSKAGSFKIPTVPILVNGTEIKSEEKTLKVNPVTYKLSSLSQNPPPNNQNTNQLVVAQQLSDKAKAFDDERVALDELNEKENQLHNIKPLHVWDVLKPRTKEESEQYIKEHDQEVKTKQAAVGEARLRYLAAKQKADEYRKKEHQDSEKVITDHMNTLKERFEKSLDNLKDENTLFAQEPPIELIRKVVEDGAYSQLDIEVLGLKRGDLLESMGHNGIPRGTKIYPIKILFSNNFSRAYYFYKDEFRDWKFYLD